MALVLGTPDGVYYSETEETFDHVLDERVTRLRRFSERLLAATVAGVYESTDGRHWEQLTATDGIVHSVQVLDNGRLIAGTNPAQILASDDGTDWRVAADLAHPDAERWADRSFRDGASVRTLAVDDHAGRLLAGIEPGGVLVSADGGESWGRRSRGLHDDVHHLLVAGADEYVASTGNGLYRSTDGADTWLRLDTDFREFWDNYHREATIHEGMLVSAARSWGPEQPDAVILEHDGSGTYGAARRVSPPGAPAEFPLSFASDGDRLLAGTMRHADDFEPMAPARVAVRNSDGEWSTLCETPAAVKSLVTV